MFTTLKFSEMFSCERRIGGDIYAFYEFDVALCGITLENAALSLSLFGHLRFICCFC